MPVHNKCDAIKNKTQYLLGATHAAEAVTQETHCSCTRHVPRRVPRPCPCTIGVMKSRTDHLSAVTHAAEAATQETHCSCTRHVPRRVPRPCPCTTGVMKSRTIIYLQSRMQQRPRTRRHTAVAQGTYQHASSMPVHNRCNEIKDKAQHLLGATHAAEATTQETHCSYTRHVPRRVPRPCPCTTGVMKSRTDYLSALAHAAEATAHETHCCCTRHVPRRVPCPYRCTTDFNKIRYINRKSISILTCNKGHDIGGVHSACTEARTSSMHVHKRL